jgi:Cytochrome P450
MCTDVVSRIYRFLALLSHCRSRTFLFAGTDTTSTALSRVLWLLSEHQDVQDRIREELAKARDTGETIDYDYLHNLPYLEAVCRETLRVYVPLGPTIASQLISAFVRLPSSFRNFQNVSDHFF